MIARIGRRPGGSFPATWPTSGTPASTRARCRSPWSRRDFFHAQIIWAKDRFALARGDYHWQHEPCWYAVRKGRRGNWQGSRSQSTRWDIAARDDNGHGHGTQKPVEAMLRPMLNNSIAGQTVYEPFCGSGTSVVAAEMS